MTDTNESADSSAEKILEAAAGLKEAITDAKAKLLLALEGAVKVGYHMRQAQKSYYAAKTGKQELLIEAKRLEAAFDRRLAELKALGVEFNKCGEGDGRVKRGAGHPVDD